MNDVVERVKAERQWRGWSMRAAAEAGGISNQSWSTFERTGVVTNGIHAAVIRAFSWPGDWQTNLPEIPDRNPAETSALRAEIQGLRQQMTEVLEVMVDLVVELRARDGETASPAKPAPQRRNAAAR